MMHGVTLYITESVQDEKNVEASFSHEEVNEGMKGELVYFILLCVSECTYTYMREVWLELERSPHAGPMRRDPASE